MSDKRSEECRLLSYFPSKRTGLSSLLSDHGSECVQVGELVRTQAGPLVSPYASWPMVSKVLGMALQMGNSDLHY